MERDPNLKDMDDQLYIDTATLSMAFMLSIDREGFGPACDLIFDGVIRLGKRGPVIDVEHIKRQREFSRKAFGPGRRTAGVLDHIRKECEEVEEHPTDLYEWVDLIILAFDGAWRSGHEPEAIIEAIKAKQARNEERTWPDWRELSEDQAIEHVRPNVHDLGCDGDHHLDAVCNPEAGAGYPDDYDH